MSGNPETILDLPPGVTPSLTSPIESIENDVSVRYEFGDIVDLVPGQLPITTFSGTIYVWVLTDAQTMRLFSNAATITATIPPHSSVAFPIGTTLNLAQLGAGGVTWTAGSGVSILALNSHVTSSGVNAGSTALQIAIDTWLLMGNLA